MNKVPKNNLSCADEAFARFFRKDTGLGPKALRAQALSDMSQPDCATAPSQTRRLDFSASPRNYCQFAAITGFSVDA
jgi:hypothetical protein